MIKVSKKIILTLAVLSLLVLVFSAYSENCPAYADTQEEFLGVIRAAWVQWDKMYVMNDTRRLVLGDEISDMMNFYSDVKGWSKLDCGVKGKKTKKTIKELLELVYKDSQDNPIPKCSDGTEYGKCSANKPSYCFSGNIVNLCSTCGCPDGLTCKEEKCKKSEEIGQPPALCKSPTDGMMIKQDTTLCKGNYNLAKGITVQGERASLNCNGAALIGNNQGEGIRVQGGSYASIKNCVVRDYSYGLLVKGSSNLAVESNEFRKNTYGIYVDSSNKNEFTNNLIMHNTKNSFYVTGSADNVILKNTIYGSSVYDANQNGNVYCREGVQNDYYAQAEGPKCELPDCGDGKCDKGENCFNCEDCRCGESSICLNWQCKKQKGTLSKFQTEACKSADKANTCERLPNIGIVTQKQCCDILGKCCE